MSASNIYKIPLSDDPAPKDKGTVSPRVGVVTRRQSKPKTTQYSSTPTLSVSSSTSGNYSVSKSTDSDPTASPATRNLRSRRPKGSSTAVNPDNYDDRAYASQATSPQGAEDSDNTQSEQTPHMEGGKRGTSINMSASNVYNSPLPDDPAPKDKGAVSLRIGVVTRRQAKPRTQQYSSTPTLSVESSISENYSVSRSTDSDPTASPTTRNLRSRRSKGSSSTDNHEDRVYASRAASHDAEDSEDTQSERTPLVENSSVDITMSDDTEEDARNDREFNLLMKFLFSILLGVIGIFTFALAHFYWYKDVPQIPVGFVSNTTEMIDTDANMDMD